MKIGALDQDHQPENTLGWTKVMEWNITFLTQTSGILM